jgi:hypothetical protein
MRGGALESGRNAKPFAAKDDLGHSLDRRAG